MHHPKRVVLAVIAALLIIGGISTTFALRRPSQVHAAGGFPAHYYAPYVDMGAWPTQSLVTDTQNGGIKYYTLAFVTNMGSCTAAWAGAIPLSQLSVYLPNLDSDIDSLRGQGGDVIGSFGGQAGTELAQSCSSVSALQTQYQSIISHYNLTHIDFDIEGPAVEDAASIDLRNKAIQALQSANPGLVVSYTLPVLPTGLVQSGLNLLSNAISNGVNVSVVNIMAMDYGSSFPGNQMGQNAVNAASNLYNQLHTLYPSKSSSQLWAMVGITPMSGANDVGGETFTTADAQQVLTFAQQNNITELALWSVNRDQPGYSYSAIFNQFNGGSVISTPPVGSGWTQCAGENQNCAFSGSAAVAYGAAGQFAYGTFTNGVSCSNGVFGDPDYGVGKSCYVSTSFVPPAPGVWTQCANENGTCSFSGTMQVAYGNSGHYTYGTYTNGVSCSNSVFPDPDYGVGKVCFTAPSGTNVSTPTPTPPPANTPTIIPTSPPSNGLVNNGGFETGNLNGWACDAGTAVITSPVHSGNYALQLNPTSSLTGQCTQTINVQANRSYTLTAYVYGNYAYLGVNGGASTWTSSTGYTQLSVPFTTGASQTSITIYMHGWYAQGTVYVDDVSLA
jgi:Glycosyl hydrolases family 18/Carbohydrate binding domain